MGRRPSYLVLFLGLAVTGCNGLEKTADFLSFKAMKAGDRSIARGLRERIDRAAPAFDARNKETPAVPDSLAWARYYHGQAKQANTPPAKQAALWNKARDSYLETLVQDKNHLDALCGLGSVLSEQGEHDQAITVYNRAVKKHPKEPAVHCGLAACYGRRDDWSAAIASLKTAAELAPNNQEFQQMLGYALVRARRVDEGFDMLAKVVGAPEAHYRVAEALHEAKQSEKCAHHLYLALAADPGMDRARELLKQVKNLPKSDTDFGSYVATLDFQGDSVMPSGDVRPAGSYEVQRPDQDRITFHHGAAERIRRSWDEGRGWCIVTGLQNMEVLPGSGATQHVKYRMATSATFSGSLNDPHVELYFGPESNWIVAHINDGLDMPVQPGPAALVTEKTAQAVHDLESLRFQVLAQIASDQTSAQKRTELRQAFLPIVERQIISLRSLLDKNPSSR